MDALEQLPIPLLQWYGEHARELPWRKNVTAYRVWVSEIMLQQTRVAAVLGYFARFMEALPTVKDLAEVPEDQLLKLWQGLGYYSRARNLQQAARQIMEQFGGVFPTEYEEIRSLAGVGDYTAGAIASIAFALPYPAVDGNLLRVAARVSGDDTDITTTAGKKYFTKRLTEVIPVEMPGRFNQAMMDLGATVCLPHGVPLCDRCPAREFCVAYQTGRTGVLPVRPKKKPRRVEERTVFFCFHAGKVALRKRPERGLLAKLWEFPNVLGETFPEEWGLVPEEEPRFVGTGVHLFSHVEWRMTARECWLAKPLLPDGWVWADRRELREVYAIPSAFSAFQDIAERGTTE